MLAFSKLCLLVAPFVLLPVAAGRADQPELGSTPGLFRRQDPGTVNDACYPSCDIDTCGSSCSAGTNLLRKRSWADNPFSNTSHEEIHALGKRLFTFVPGSTDPNDYSGVKEKKPPTKEVMQDYLLAVINDNAEEDYYGTPLSTVQLNANNQVMDERPFSQQIVFGDTPFQIQSSMLHGCTVAILVSKRAVWMAHFWESYSNGKYQAGVDENGVPIMKNYVEPGDPRFKQRVIDFFTGTPVDNAIPNGYRPYIPPTAPSIDRTLFNMEGDQTKIYILTPTLLGTNEEEKNQATKLKYNSRYAARNSDFQVALSDYLGAYKAPRIVVRGYIPLNTNDNTENEMLGTTLRGMSLFQYDPNSDGKGTKAWRILFEKANFFVN